MTKEELRDVLNKHQKWLMGECDGVRANLSRANLSDANLSRANLSDANLSRADLTRANLSRANLSDANLSRANLSDANLTRADLTRAKNIDKAINLFYPIACPDYGDFIGWKKAIADGNEIIVKLFVTGKRSSATTRKCRCSEAKVVSIESIDGKTKFEQAHSSFDTSFVYKVGEFVGVSDFDENRWKECSTGIHFFVTREEALRYVL